MVSLGHMGPKVLVPLIVQGRAIGTLAVANPVGGAVFEEQEVRLVETFANQASVALAYSRAQRELQRLAVLDDRERIARELHDGVIQSLFAVGMGLQAVAQRSGDREVESRVESAVSEIDRAIRDLRNYIFGLRPGLLADRQLRQALDDLIADFTEKSGVTTVPDIDEGLAAELAPRAKDRMRPAHPRGADSRARQSQRVDFLRVGLRLFGLCLIVLERRFRPVQILQELGVALGGDGRVLRLLDELAPARRVEGERSLADAAVVGGGALVEQPLEARDFGLRVCDLLLGLGDGSLRLLQPVLRPVVLLREGADLSAVGVDLVLERLRLRLLVVDRVGVGATARDQRDERHDEDERGGNGNKQSANAVGRRHL